MYSGAPPAPAPVTCDRGNKSDKLQQTQANAETTLDPDRPCDLLLAVSFTERIRHRQCVTRHGSRVVPSSHTREDLAQIMKPLSFFFFSFTP